MRKAGARKLIVDRLGQEVEDGAIVPYIVSARGKCNLDYIPNEPIDFLCRSTEAVSGFRDRGLRNIEDGERAIVHGKQIIGQRGLAAYHVDDGSRPIGGRFRNPVERCLQARLKPTRLHWRLRLIDVLPMVLQSHALWYRRMN